MASLLVTNDFPPKLGGIQSYLYELWRRLPAEETTVLTTRHRDADEWDQKQPFRIVRLRQRVLLPTPEVARRIEDLVREVGADVVFLDPMLPLGLVSLRLNTPCVLITHGSEVTVPGRLPGTRALAQRALSTAVGIVAAGQYPAAEAGHALGVPVPGIVVPPGVDVERFRPLDDGERSEARARFGLDAFHPLVVGVSRLVPRKGFDRLFDALAWLDPRVQVAIAGTGRDLRRLRHLARVLGERAHFLGQVSEDDLPMLYGAADVFAMPCRDRWGGLEAEGFGIVFLEAAACGIPVLAGRSGGSHEAVVDGETGYVVDARRVRRVYGALERLLGDAQRRARMGRAARQRAVEEFSYDKMVERLAPIAAGDLDVLTPLPVG
jgi:phosphatidylinositol alpha-1,6-mannosyltransferase